MSCPTSVVSAEEYLTVPVTTFTAVPDLVRQVLEFLSPIQCRQARLVNCMWNDCRPWSHVDWRFLLLAHSIHQRVLQYRARSASKKTCAPIVSIREKYVGEVLLSARNVLMQDPVVMTVSSPATVVGALHGDVAQLVRIFTDVGFPLLGNPHNREEESMDRQKPQSTYVFLGRYTNHGKASVDTLVLLCCWKLLAPSRVVMLRGKDECASIQRVYGGYDEFKRKYNIKLWKRQVDLCNVLPLAAVVDGHTFCISGGLSPDMNMLYRGSASGPLPDYTAEEVQRHRKELMTQIQASYQRPHDVPDDGLVCDLMWSDFDASDPYGMGWHESDRGVSFSYTGCVVDWFLQAYGFRTLILTRIVEHVDEWTSPQKGPRGRCVEVEEGVVVRDGDGGVAPGVVSLFSTPNYRGEFGNTATVAYLGDPRTAARSGSISYTTWEHSGRKGLFRPPTPRLVK